MSLRALLAVCVYAAMTLATGYPGQAQVRDPALVTDAMLQDPDPAIGGSSWATILPGDLLREERNPRGGSGVFVFALPAGVAAPQPPDLPGVARVTIEVELSCPSCAAGLERRLRRLDYVSGVEISPSDGRIVLAVEPGRHLDPAAVWDTVRNAGFVPDRMAVTASGHVIDGNGTPALALSPDFALPLVETDGLTTMATEAGDQLVQVTGDWNASPDGAGRLRVESFEVRWQLPPRR